jgi:hypothetical protein
MHDRICIVKKPFLVLFPLSSEGMSMARPKKSKVPKEIEFDFIKSNFFRVIRSDGAFGGLAPNGSVHMGIYSERQPIPTKMVHKVEAGKLGAEMRERRQGRKAIVREVEADIVMDIQQAIILRDWLGEKIKQYEELIGPIPEQNAPKAKTNGRVRK